MTSNTNDIKCDGCGKLLLNKDDIHDHWNTTLCKDCKLKAEKLDDGWYKLIDELEGSIKDGQVIELFPKNKSKKD